MIEIRRSSDRGHFDFDWLNTYHSFSFADYYDPKNVQHGALRVLNEDFIQPGQGFGTHGHKDMEIVTYVLSGALAHKDSTGGEDVIHAGEVQRMTAGAGIRHSEFNASKTEPVHLLQVWFFPNKADIAPGYEQKDITVDAKDKLVPIVTPEKRADSLTIHQDVTFNISNLSAGKSVETSIAKDRLGYLHNAMVGEIVVNGETLAPGDGLKITGPEKLKISANTDARFVVFDLGSPK